MTNILAGGLRDALGARACEDPHCIAIMYERGVHGDDDDDFNRAFPQLDWDTCPKAWFVFVPPRVVACVFPDREDMPLPESVRNRMAALDITTQRTVSIPGLGTVRRYEATPFAGDVTYNLEITPAGYDQLVAALGEDRA